MVAAVRTLLIVQAVGGVLALLPLSVLLLVQLAFGAFGIALGVLVAWIALACAIALALVGQYRLRRGGRRWWWAMTGLEALVIVAGIALEAYLLVPTRSGVPAPPMVNVALVLVLTALAVINLALLFTIRNSDSVVRARD